MPCITSGEMLQSHEQPERTADDASTAELIRKALADMQELARAEVALAGKELGTEARGALVSSVVLSASGFLSASPLGPAGFSFFVPRP